MRPSLAERPDRAHAAEGRLQGARRQAHAGEDLRQGAGRGNDLPALVVGDRAGRNAAGAGHLRLVPIQNGAQHGERGAEVLPVLRSHPILLKSLLNESCRKTCRQDTAPPPAYAGSCSGGTFRPDNKQLNAMGAPRAAMAAALPAASREEQNMSGKNLRRKIAALAVLAVFAASWMEADMRGAPSRRFVAPAASWSLLERLWTSLTGLVVKAGCSLDPSGADCPRNQFPKNGCTIDPSGASCPASQSPKNGCSLDPSGVCAPASPKADAGCSLDP